MHVKAIVGRVGEQSRLGLLWTEDALREAAANNPNLTFEDGVLYYSGSVQREGVEELKELIAQQKSIESQVLA